MATPILGGVSTDAIPVAEDDSPTTEFTSVAAGDRCTNCQAPLATDQRYCINCGQRRGKPRFAAGAMALQPSPPTEPTSVRAAPRLWGFSSGATLVAGIATLLIAMGVGVLIGHDSNTTPVRASAPPVITVGGGATAGTGAASTAGAGAGAVKKAGRKSKKVTVKTVHVSAAANKKAAAAVTKVLGNGGNLAKNPTVQQGQSCSGGAGCQGGKFTGNFFGQ